MKIRRLSQWFGIAIPLVLLLVSSLQGTVRAASLMVNTLVDENDHSCGDGDCSLRDAIEVASAGEVITFGVTGTIALVLDQLIIDKELTITGPGASDLIVSGDSTYRVFQIQAGVTATIGDITIADGLVTNFALPLDGDGIRNVGTLTLNNCILSSNGPQGSLPLGLGGGIYNAGTLYVTDCSFTNNIGSSGGGIYNSGTADVSNSLFTENESVGEFVSTGGGITNSGTLDVTNSTFFENSAYGTNKYSTGYGGGISNTGGLDVLNSTFADNFAHVGENLQDEGGTTTLKNTIVTRMAGGWGNCAGRMIDGGGNLRWPLADSSCVGVYGNPKLAALADNSGPTWTMALGENSPALESSVGANCPAADQRGHTRPDPAASLCDSGAYESDLRPTVITWEDDNPNVQFGGWRGQEFTDARGINRVSGTEDDTATFSFTGKHVVWFTQRGPEMGIAQILIDNVDYGLVDLYRATTELEYKQKFRDLSYGVHKLIIRVTGDKNASATDANIVVDAFKIKNVTHNTNHGVKYNTWKGKAKALASEGGYRASKARNAVAQLTFTGTQIDWITARGPAYGKAEVLIDGISKGRYDLYAPTLEWKVPITFDGLSAGEHTIEIRVLDKRNAASSGKKVVVDAFSKPVEP